MVLSLFLAVHSRALGVPKTMAPGLLPEPLFMITAGKFRCWEMN